MLGEGRDDQVGHLDAWVGGQKPASARAGRFGDVDQVWPLFAVTTSREWYGIWYGNDQSHHHAR